jgi:clan AA aspartic protease
MQLDGYFNQRDEPVVTLNIGSLSIEVLVDTGFGGSLFIPGRIANRLDKKFEGPEEFQSVTGEVFLADAYSTSMDWLGRSIRVPVATSKEVNLSILGSQLLKGCCLTIDYRRRTVTIRESRSATVVERGEPDVDLP